jgi:thioredoxin-related protein
MKKLVIALLIVFSINAKAQEIKWTTLNQALTLQKKSPKPIFIDVYTDWCGPCKVLDKKTFHDKAVADYINANYYAVKFNAEGNSAVTYKGVKYGNKGYVANKKGKNTTHDLVTKFKVPSYPAMVIIGKTGSYSKTILGLRSATELLSEIKK